MVSHLLSFLLFTQTFGFCYFEINVVSQNENNILYYCSLAVEGLPKHKQYNGFSSVEKSKAEAVLRDAFMKAESLKEWLKKKYEEEAVLAKQRVVANVWFKYM